MTNKEIEILKNMKRNVLADSKEDKALDLAINALENPTEKLICEIRIDKETMMKVVAKNVEKLRQEIEAQFKFEGKTNGDVIRALFSNISIVNVFGGDIWFKVDNSYLQCSESWWNSPYKEGEDEQGDEEAQSASDAQ